MNKELSLIGLMIVMAVVGLLSAIALLQYQLHTLRAQVSTQITDAQRPLLNAISEYLNRYGALPSAGFSGLCKIGFLQDSGIEHTTSYLNTDYIEPISLNGQLITLTFSSNQPLSTQTVPYRGSSDNHGASYRCLESSSIPKDICLASPFLHSSILCSPAFKNPNQSTV